MNINRINLKVRKEEGECKRCGAIKKFYYLPDSSYGEKFIPIQGGEHYAFANLFEDEILEELEEIAKLLFEKYNVTLSRLAFAECLNKLLGLTCDMVENELVDTVNCNQKCLNCGYDKFSFGEDLKIAIVDIEATVITHCKWDALNECEKIEVVENELKNLKYID